MKKFLPFIFLIFTLGCEKDCNCDLTDEPLECNLTYAGFWTADSNCSDDQDTYTMTFNESDDCKTATIYNFLDNGETINIEFKSVSLSIPEQQLNDRYDIYGSGFINNDTLKLTFSKVDLVFGGSEILCELKAVKE